MTKITNTDTRASINATIITFANNDLSWCIAVWAAPSYGRTMIDGNGHGWQIVRANRSGSYTYNSSMMGGFADSLDDAKAIALRAGYELVAFPEAARG